MPSNTNKTSLTGVTFSITLRTLASSSIKLLFVCSRPAVSMIKTSNPSALAFVAPSKQTAAGSAFSAPRTTSTPIRSPQVLNCCTAAARKVSAATSKTFLPSDLKRFANLAALVVFPVPFTPTIKIVVGPSDCQLISRGSRVRKDLIRSVTACSKFSDFSLFTSSIISSLFFTPKSDSIKSLRNSSISSIEARLRENFERKEPNNPIAKLIQSHFRVSVVRLPLKRHRRALLHRKVHRQSP